MNSKKIIISLIIISLGSLTFKLYLSDFSIPVNSDNLAYVLNAIAHNSGDFSHPPHRAIGWSLFLTPFFSLIDSENFLDYSNMAKSISIGVSLSSIFVVYLIGRKFFDARYSIVAACLFAFSPQLNYNSAQALSEPLFILTILVSFYFLLHEKSKFIIISLIFAGFAYWIRLNGLVMFLIISITYLLTFKKSLVFLRNYGIAVILFVIVISPIMLEKNQEYGDPFYSSYQGTMFSENYENLISNISSNTQTSASGYIEKEGGLNFLNNFFFNGISKSINILAALTFPYLFILIPFGILFSLRAFDQKSKFIKANWIFILSSVFITSIIIAIIPEKRFLFFILPFLILFCVIPIQRVVEYGLNTFSFTRKQKNVFLIIVLIIVVILSGLFSMRYEKTDYSLENEKLDFAKYALENLDGNVLRDFGGSTDYITAVVILHHNDFKDFKIDYWKDKEERKEFGFKEIGVYAKSLNELIANGELSDLKYLISNEQETFYYPFIDNIYHNEETFPFLTKIFDSDEFGYEKLHIKIFEINYQKFNDLKN